MQALCGGDEGGQEALPKMLACGQHPRRGQLSNRRAIDGTSRWAVGKRCALALEATDDRLAIKGATIHEMRHHIPDHPACAGTGKLPSGGREGMQIALERRGFYCDMGDTVCKGVHAVCLL